MSNKDLQKLYGKTIKQIYWSIDALNIEFDDGSGVQIQFNAYVNTNSEFIGISDSK